MRKKDKIVDLPDGKKMVQHADNKISFTCYSCGQVNKKVKPGSACKYCRAA